MTQDSAPEHQQEHIDMAPHPFVETDIIDRGVRAYYPMRCQTCGKHLSAPSHNQQDAGEEEWEVKPTLVADWEFWQVWEKQGQDGGQMIADFIATEEIALGILADHAAARRARKLEAAIRAQPRIQHLQQFPHVKPNQWEQMLLAALLSPATGKEEAG